MERLLSEQAERTLVRLEAGGFRLEATGIATIRVEPAGAGWRVTGNGPGDGWDMSREPSDQGGGFRLDAGSVWVGRTLALAGFAEVPGLRHVLLADGRLFRMMLCGTRSARFELRGWETSGAYLVARPDPGGTDRWTIAPTTAGESLKDRGAIQILFAAEINQSDSGHRPKPGGGPGET